MSLALNLAHSLIQNKLQALALTHLTVRVQKRSLFIYSIDQDQDEHYRAAITLLAHNLFMLSIANPRGRLQPVPYFGNVTELLSILTDKFAFALTRWSRE